MSLKERAQATIAAGYRAFRFGAADTPANTIYNTHQKLNQMYDECVQAREGVGKKERLL
jgi:galactonate dehydratase